MATKDWKKHNGDLWSNENPRNLKNFASEIWVRKDRETQKYEVIFDRETLRTFKTKNQAMSFAKSYMRSH